MWHLKCGVTNSSITTTLVSKHSSNSLISSIYKRLFWYFHSAHIEWNIFFRRNLHKTLLFLYLHGFLACCAHIFDIVAHLHVRYISLLHIYCSVLEKKKIKILNKQRKSNETAFWSILLRSPFIPFYCVRAQMFNIVTVLVFQFKFNVGSVDSFAYACALAPWWISIF